MNARSDDNVDLVNKYLRAQNLEQVGRDDEAVGLYEAAVAQHFDSAGPYDRLIAIYANRAAHKEVVRVAQAALGSVKTYDDKRAWYEAQRREALKAQSRLPQAAPRKRPS
ncbi:MAG: hypothetical protein ACRDKZ_02385 [Actinomycetota bacterium]